MIRTASGPRSATSREACAKYKRALDKILPPEWSEAVYTENAADVIDRPLVAELQLTSEREEDVRILNTALAAELEAIAAYQVGAESGLLQKPVLSLAVTFQAHLKAHAGVLASTVEKLGCKSVAAKSKYDFPTASLKSQEDVLKCLPQNRKNLVVKAGFDVAGYADTTHVYVTTPSVNGSTRATFGGRAPPLRATWKATCRALR